MTRPYLAVAGLTIVPLVTVLAVGALRPGALAAGRATTVEDFGAYWTGTVVNLRGQNAYDPGTLAPLQAAIEPDRPAVLPAWSPPWTFAALAPFAPLDFATARWAWLFVQLGTVIGSATALWRLYRGPDDRLVWSWALALLWYPTVQMLGLGQHSSLVLLGVVGWLACLAGGRGFVAGLFLGLVLVKPQNLHLLGLLTAVWALDRRAWGFLAGGLLSAAVLTAGAAGPNPAVFAQYRDALTGRPPAEMVTPTLGTLLRLAFGPERFWLAFTPAVAAAVWGLWYYRKHRAKWDWPTRLPLVLFVSYLTSPYGWVYDQVLFLIPLIQVAAGAARKGRTALLAVVAVTAAVTAACVILFAAKVQEFSFVWLAPLALVLYLAARAALRRDPVFPAG